MSETTNLHTSLAAVQAELPTVTQSRTVEVETRGGGSYSYTYATLADVHAAVLPLLARHGLSWACIPDVPDRVLTGILTHAETGETLPPALWPLPDTRDPQAIGSAITYGRRYLLSAVVGVVTEDDDDGRRAQHHHQQQAQRPAEPDVDPRVRAADLVLEYVPHEHHDALWNAYQSGATSVDDLDDENVGRVVRALSSKHQRTRVLEGVAQAAAADGDDDDGEDGHGGAALAGDGGEPDGGPVAPDEAPAPQTVTQDDEQDGPVEELVDGEDPSALLAEHYHRLTVADISELVRHGTTTVEADGRTVELTMPPGEGGLRTVYRLEQATGDSIRRTVVGTLGSAGFDPPDPRDERDEAEADDGIDDLTVAELLDVSSDLLERLPEASAGRFRRRLGEVISEADDGVPDRDTLAGMVRHARRLLG